ncbi:hypothetical protein HK104_005386, partial [Borealophlyctis nickersoniae]
MLASSQVEYPPLENADAPPQILPNAVNGKRKRGDEDVEGSKTTVSEYELERQRNIERNKEVLRSLGLMSDSLAEKPVVQSEPKAKEPAKKRAFSAGRALTRAKIGKPPPVVRTSRRIKGDAPELTTAESIAQIDLLESLTSSRTPLSSVQLPVSLPSIDEPSIPLTTKLGSAPINLCLPLTLTSIRVTIWEFGRLVTDPERAGLYWSHKSCTFKHPYPVGFRATKNHFNREWTMEIAEGADGPVFKVTSDTGITYEGPTPTKPWTDVCIALAGKHGKTRISGPLFFGFSDLITQALVERCDG